jgi:hypothetical protein
MNQKPTARYTTSESGPSGDKLITFAIGQINVFPDSQLSVKHAANLDASTITLECFYRFQLASLFTFT